MSSKAKSLALSLLRQNRKFKRSWRVIAREDFNGTVNHATLNRIAINRGTWLPKDKNILIALGLIQPRKEKKRMPQNIFDMGTAQLRKALQNRKTMPPPDPRILNQFVKLGWMKKERIRN